MPECIGPTRVPRVSSFHLNKAVQSVDAAGRRHWTAVDAAKTIAQTKKFLLQLDYKCYLIAAAHLEPPVKRSVPLLGRD